MKQLSYALTLTTLTACGGTQVQDCLNSIDNGPRLEQGYQLVDHSKCPSEVNDSTQNFIWKYQEVEPFISSTALQVEELLHGRRGDHRTQQGIEDLKTKFETQRTHFIDFYNQYEPAQCTPRAQPCIYFSENYFRMIRANERSVDEMLPQFEQGIQRFISANTSFREAYQEERNNFFPNWEMLGSLLDNVETAAREVKTLPSGENIILYMGQYIHDTQEMEKMMRDEKTRIETVNQRGNNTQ
ncbi:hypothetical protein HYV86_02825 [Candidatus Woesearchaeota archaeon]|nr:hypothetical protein [Candidatus Woesearchaeota archaeon]